MDQDRALALLTDERTEVQNLLRDATEAGAEDREARSRDRRLGRSGPVPVRRGPGRLDRRVTAGPARRHRPGAEAAGRRDLWRVRAQR